MNFKRHLLIWAGLFCAWAAGAQTSTFTYQGQLVSGSSAVTGLYDLRFTLYDTFNNNTNLLDGPVTNAPVPVTNGLFTVTINFTNSVSDFVGGPRALAIAVRPYGSTSAYTALTPYQSIQSTPYAIQAINAMSLNQPLAATNLTGILPLSDLSSNVALLNTNEVVSGSVSATNFYGSGSGLTNIPTTSLTGILPDYLLSSNVARLNTNAVFQTNVIAVQFTGSGYGLTNVPGAFFWETVNGTVSASSNEGYIVTNGVTPVIITLPANPNPGDTFRVAGAGTAGWIVAQNSGQQILAGNLAAIGGLSWTQQTNSGAHYWTGLASSADGTRLAATSTTGLYTSTNSGQTWTEVLAGNLSSVACSADGSHLVATVGTTAGATGYIYSSPNYGVNWYQDSPPAADWIACATSASGNEVVAVSYSGYIYSSYTAASSWSGSSTSLGWTGVALSADGTKGVISFTGGQGGYVYPLSIPTNTSGGGYIIETNSGQHAWSAVACSADGTHFLASVTGNGGLYASENAGANWFQVNPNVSVNWTAVASSADGSHLAAVYDTGTSPSTPGYVYTSDDSGSTWLQRFSPPNAPWTAVASSADGSRLVAANYGGYIYTSGQGGTTTGTTGYLFGSYQSALELQYMGNGVFIALESRGNHYRALMNAEVWDKRCGEGIFGLFLGILVYSALAFGGVGPWEFLGIQALTMGVLVLWAARLWLNPQPRFLWPPIAWCALAFALYAIGRYLTCEIEYAGRLELLQVIVCTLLFLAVINNLYRQEMAQATVFTLIILAMGTSSYSLFQFITHSPHIWVALTENPGRFSGTFMSPDHFCAYLEMILPLVLSLILVGRIKPLTGCSSVIVS